MNNQICDCEWPEPDGSVCMVCRGLLREVDQRLALERKVRELQALLATLRTLLIETKRMHLRYEANRDWLERRDAVLDAPIP